MVGFLRTCRIAEYEYFILSVEFAEPHAVGSVLMA